MNMYPSIYIHVSIKWKINVTARVTELNQCQVNCAQDLDLYVFFIRAVRVLCRLYFAPIIDHYRPDNKGYIIDDDPIGREVLFLVLTMKHNRFLFVIRTKLPH